ncbi:MAG: L-seryl-tRNA(Sec) selenium transferase [Bacteroidales bacterium]|nr:L-seryl-tRNA(Sec) selenium transferase [Bacteroidales bacterium]
MKSKMEDLKNLPGIDKLLNFHEIKELIGVYQVDLVKHVIRNTIAQIRKEAFKSKKIPSVPEIILQIKKGIKQFNQKSLKNVMNATGVVVHTNLGRAPFSDDIISEAAEILRGYNNLEFDLEKGFRGSRNTHLTRLLTFLTGAEDVLVVNNNAAAIMLILRTFAKEKEVIVSRGELIEIGGSFRLPDIMAASDCKMIEVGTTNKTRIKDYEDHITNNTALLLKAHQSNYIIQGFTQEASLAELVTLGKQHGIPVVYDMGSGLLRKTSIDVFRDEPDVKQTLATGIGLVCFSGDKLLGGAQAGIIAGNKELVAILKREPMVRALRVGKTTLAIMEAAMFYYLDDKELVKKNMLFSMMTTKTKELKNRAEKLHKILSDYQIPSIVVESKGQCGGGALPGQEIDSFAVRIEKSFETNKQKSGFAEKLYSGLMTHESPVVAILRKGDVYFDVLTIPEAQYDKLATTVKDVYFEI